MHDFITIPPRVYRAFKRLPMKEHTAKSTQRYAEFVRLAVTAYDFTLTYSDSYFLVRCEWPKPKTWGNDREDMFWYLTKTEFANLGKGVEFKVPECSVSPFAGGDILSDSAINRLLDLTADTYKSRMPQSAKAKYVDARYLAQLTRTIDMILSEDRNVRIDFGCASYAPVVMAASDKQFHVYGLVMPIRK